MADELEQQALFPLRAGYCVGTMTDGEGKVEQVFAFREDMTLSERLWVIEWMRRQAWALMHHADALLAETDTLIAAGKLATEDEP